MTDQTFRIKGDYPDGNVHELELCNTGHGVTIYCTTHHSSIAYFAQNKISSLRGSCLFHEHQIQKMTYAIKETG